MLHSKALKSIAAILLVAAIFTACKKDTFSEKDALAAQKDLLSLKFSYDLSIAQVNLQIQRSGDSAKIAIQNLVNSGASALALANFNYTTALKLQDLTNLMNELKFRDSLSRAQNAYYRNISDSLSRIAAAGGVKSYQVRVIDARTSAPVAGASVRVLPWQASAFVTATANTDGVAVFNNVIVDPNSIFYATDPTAGVTSATTLVKRSDIDAGNAIPVYRYTTATPGPTVKGTLFAATDLTNGATPGNAGAGRLVTFTTFFTPSIGTVATANVSFQFSVLTDIAGTYSISLPSNLSYSVSTPGTVTVNQKQFVNYFEGLENPFTAVPRIDSVATTLSKTLNNFGIFNTKGYYFLLPKDSVTGAPVYVSDNFNSLLNNIAANVRGTNGFPLDTLSNGFFMNGSNFGLNNGYNPPNGSAPVSASSDPLINYPVRLDPVTFNRVNDTLAVTLVDLTGQLVKTAPNLMLVTNPNGKVGSIQLRKNVNTGNNPLPGAGGTFNYTALGGAINIFGPNSVIFNRSLPFTGANTTSIFLNTTTQTVNFFYYGIVSRAGNVTPR